MTPETALACAALFTIISTAVMALLGWRVDHSHQQQIETLRTRLDLQAHAGKLTFDKEFELLQDLWRALDKLQQSSELILLTAPSFGTATAKEKRLVEEFLKQYRNHRDLVRENRPFYAKEIYEALREILDTTIAGTQYYRTRNLLDMPTLQERMKDLGKLNKQIDAACEKIREHLFELECEGKSKR